MNQVMLHDDMKKESRNFLKVIFIEIIISIFYPLFILIYEKDNYEDIHALYAFLFFLLMSLISLYGYVYSKTYLVQADESTIEMKTLFIKVLINFKELTSVSIKRYGKSVFYLFKMTTKGNKPVTISTRYKDDLVRLIKNSNASLEIFTR